MLDLQQPNILMRILIVSTNEHFFIYSNSNGVKNIEKTLENNPLFYNLLSPTEIFQKLSDFISYNVGTNPYNGMTNSYWNGRFLRIAKNDEFKFYKKFQPWLLQLEQLVGKKNIFNVNISEEDFENFFKRMPETTSSQEKNTYFIQFLENHRLHAEFDSALSSNNNSIKKNKI